MCLLKCFPVFFTFLLYTDNPESLLFQNKKYFRMYFFFKILGFPPLFSYFWMIESWILIRVESNRPKRGVESNRIESNPDSYPSLLLSLSSFHFPFRKGWSSSRIKRHLNFILFYFFASHIGKCSAIFLIEMNDLWIATDSQYLGWKSG